MPTHTQAGKTFRDAIHGDVRVLRHEIPVINTPTFQRLHKIRQLDLAYRVYPDAVHTRYQHVIGTAFVASQIWTRIEARECFSTWLKEAKPPFEEDLKKLFKDPTISYNNQEVLGHIIRLGALVHDITHIPYGHMLENQLRLFKPHDSGHRWEFFLRSIIDDIKSRCTLERFSTDENYDSKTIYYLLYLLVRVTPLLVSLSDHSDVDASTTGSLNKRDSQSRSEDEALPLFPVSVLPYDNHLSDFPKIESDLFSWSQDKISESIKAGERISCKYAFVVDIIGNTICADLLDYVRRDNYFTGLWDRYDDRIFYAFNLAAVSIPGKHGPNESNRVETRLSLQVIKKTAIRHDTISNILRILELRYDLAEKVIYHHARCAAGSMLCRALCEAGITDQDEQLFYSLGDDEAIGLIAQFAEKRNLTQDTKASVSMLLSCLASRDFYKPYYRFFRNTDLETGKGPLGQLTVGEQLYDFHSVALPILHEVELTADLVRGSLSVFTPNKKMNLKETGAIISGDTSDDAIPEGEPLRDWVINHFGTRKQHIDALESRYKDLWAVTFFLHPRYRPMAELICRITQNILEKKFEMAPPQDPRLAAEIRRKSNITGRADDLIILDKVETEVIGELIVDRQNQAARNDIRDKDAEKERVLDHIVNSAENLRSDRKGGKTKRGKTSQQKPDMGEETTQDVG